MIEVERKRLGPSDVDDTPVDGVTDAPASSNWAYDHAANYGVHNRRIVKAADETVNDSTTFQDDDELKFAVAANEVWAFIVHLLQNSGTTPDLKTRVTGPSGSTVWLTRDGGGDQAASANQTHVGRGAAAYCMLSGMIINSTTAGNLQLQWAQQTQDASDSKVLANSCIFYQQIA